MKRVWNLIGRSVEWLFFWLWRFFKQAWVWCYSGLLAVGALLWPSLQSSAKLHKRSQIETGSSRFKNRRMGALHSRYLYPDLVWRLWPITLFALRSLYANTKRNILALLGIAVGLAAVVALSLAGRSAEKLALHSFKNLSLNLITIEMPLDHPGESSMFMGQGSGRSSMGGEQAPKVVRSPNQLFELLKKTIDAPGQKWPMYKGNCEFILEGNGHYLSVASAGPGMLSVMGMRIKEGRDLHKLDGAVAWVILGANVSKRMEEAGRSVKPGHPLLLCGTTVYVAGVLASSPSNNELIGEPPDEMIFMQPLPFSQSGIKANQLTVVWQVLDESRVEQEIATLRENLRGQNLHEASVRSASNILALKREQAGQHARLITLLSSISVLVGGFGIMNVMLASGLERRYDIAVCMALGADRMAIAWQFLVESTILGLVGGLLGIAAGHLLAWLILMWLDMPWQPDINSSAAALLLGATVGALSGLFPAIKVSRVDPSVVLAS